MKKKRLQQAGLQSCFEPHRFSSLVRSASGNCSSNLAPRTHKPLLACSTAASGCIAGISFGLDGGDCGDDGDDRGDDCDDNASDGVPLFTSQTRSVGLK